MFPVEIPSMIVTFFRSQTPGSHFFRVIGGLVPIFLILGSAFVTADDILWETGKIWRNIRVTMLKVVDNKPYAQIEVTSDTLPITVTSGYYGGMVQINFGDDSTTGPLEVTLTDNANRNISMQAANLLKHNNTTSKEPAVPNTRNTVINPDIVCRSIAERKYPNDVRMQQYIYSQQISAYRYMANGDDSDVKNIAINEYPSDYAMQKYVFDQQQSAKYFMSTVADEEVRQIALRKYPLDYSMQKYVYDQQMASKRYMSMIKSGRDKQHAVGKYPLDYVMQQYTYEQLTSGR